MILSNDIIVLDPYLLYCLTTADMGGGNAQFTTEQAVTNILTNIVSKVSIADSGKFLNYDGNEHPW